MKKPALLPSAGSSGGAVESSIPRVDHLAYTLTDAHGRYTALLCRRTGRLRRLGKGVRA